jgi:hypothetical protein
MSEASHQADGTAQLDDFKKLFTKSIQDNLLFLNRVSAVAREAVKGLSTVSSRSQSPTADEVAKRLVQLNLSYLTAINKHGFALLNELVSATETAFGINSGAAAAPAATPARAEINLSARQGEVAIASFLVENSYERALDVSFQASQIVSVRGEVIKSGVVSFNPPQLSLEPKSQAVVQACIDISNEFKSGENYVLRVRVVGFETKEIWIHLNILSSTQELKSATAEDDKPKRQGRKRKARGTTKSRDGKARRR